MSGLHLPVDSGPSRFGTLLRVLDALHESLTALAGDARRERQQLIAEVHAWARQEKAGERRCVFRPAEEEEPGVFWYVGKPGREQRVPGTSIGLRAAWLAISGRAPLCSDLARPGSRNPDSIVSKAVRQRATAWAEHHGCPELAEAFLRVTLRAGRLHYRAPVGAAEILTGDGQGAVNGSSPASD